MPLLCLKSGVTKELGHNLKYFVFLFAKQRTFFLLAQPTTDPEPESDVSILHFRISSLKYHL